MSPVRTFSDSQYWASFGFSGVALVSAIVLLYVYIKVTKFYWPVLYPFTKALQEVLATHSERMGFYVLVTRLPSLWRAGAVAGVAGARRRL